MHSAKVVGADMSGVERGKGMLPSDRTGPAIGIENAGPENSLANSGPDELGITISRLHAGNFCVNHSGLRNCPAMVPDPLTLTRCQIVSGTLDGLSPPIFGLGNPLGAVEEDRLGDHQASDSYRSSWARFVDFRYFSIRRTISS